MTTGTKGGGAAGSDARRHHLRELTDQQWAFGAWSNPFTAVLAVYTAGAILNLLTVSPKWTITGGLLFTASMVVATMSKHVRVLGIAYSAALSLSITGWLTYAALVPTFDVHDWPGTKNHAIAIAVGSIPFVVIYAMLIHDRNEAEAAAQRLEAALKGEKLRWHEACTKAGIKGWYWSSAASTPGGQAITMAIKPGGTTFKNALALVEQLEVSLAAPYPGAIRIERGTNAGQAVIFWNERNMLAETIPLPRETEPVNILEPITTGMHEDRIRATVTYGYQSSLSVGRREGGKSNLMNVLLSHFIRAENCLVWMVCFKQGSTAKPYLAPYAAGQVTAPAIDWIGTTPTDLEHMLDALDAIGNQRAKRRTGDKLVPTRQQPAIRLVIDEIADVMSNPALLRVQQKLVKAVRKHRSEGIDADMFTQRATMSFLGPHARDLASQIGVLNVFRLSDPAEVFNTLNIDKSRAGGIDPSQFQYEGTMLTIARDARVAPLKVFRVENDIIPALAHAGAPYRPHLEPVDVMAAGTAYARRWQTETARTLLVDAARSVGADYKPAHATTPPPTAPRSAHDTHNVVRLHKTTSAQKEAAVDLLSGVPILDQLGIGRVSARDVLIRQHGPIEGERRYKRGLGVMLLRTIQTILTAADAGRLPTRDLLDRLAATDTARWGDLTPQGMAGLLAPHNVEPKQLTTSYHPSNPRGYLLEHVEEALAVIDGDAASG